MDLTQFGPRRQCSWSENVDFPGMLLVSHDSCDGIFQPPNHKPRNSLPSIVLVCVIMKALFKAPLILGALFTVYVAVWKQLFKLFCWEQLSSASMNVWPAFVGTKLCVPQIGQYYGRVYIALSFWPSLHCCPQPPRKDCRALWSLFIAWMSGYFVGSEVNLRRRQLWQPLVFVRIVLLFTGDVGLCSALVREICSSCPAKGPCALVSRIL